MRLLILGASGGCGRWATRIAANEGHQVTAFVRPTTPFDPPPGVTVERGDALDAGAIVGRADIAAWLVRSACAGELPALRTPMIGWW